MCGEREVHRRKQLKVKPGRQLSSIRNYGNRMRVSALSFGCDNFNDRCTVEKYKEQRLSDSDKHNNNNSNKHIERIDKHQQQNPRGSKLRHAVSNIHLVHTELFMADILVALPSHTA